MNTTVGTTEEQSQQINEGKVSQLSNEKNDEHITIMKCLNEKWGVVENPRTFEKERRDKTKCRFHDTSPQFWRKTEWKYISRTKLQMKLQNDDQTSVEKAVELSYSSQIKRVINI